MLLNKSKRKMNHLLLNHFQWVLFMKNGKIISGSVWSGNNSPFVSAYYTNTNHDGDGDGDGDGDAALLHLVGKRLYVSVDNWWLPFKNIVDGVQYCQTISSEYLKNIILKQVTPPPPT
jgi:hypothetical protein